MTVPQSYDVLNASEFYTNVDGEQFGNVHLTGILNGCAVTESTSAMTVTVGAGTALVDGAIVAVTGDDVTLVSDPSNLKWNIVYVDDLGAVQIAIGDAAPDANTEPSKPSVTGAIVKEYKVQAGQSVASNVSIAIDKAVQAHPLPWVSVLGTDFTKNNSDTFGDVTGLSFPIGASETWVFQVVAQASIGATPDIKVQFTVPTSAAGTGNASKLNGASTLNIRVSDWTASNALADAAAGVGLLLSGRIVNSTTAGAVQLQAAQNTATSEDTIIYAGSYIVAWRIA